MRDVIFSLFGTKTLENGEEEKSSKPKQYKIRNDSIEPLHRNLKKLLDGESVWDDQFSDSRKIEHLISYLDGINSSLPRESKELKEIQSKLSSLRELFLYVYFEEVKDD